MDRGVAAEDRIAGLARKGYRYIGVGREARLHCYSAERAEKERAIVERFATRFETARAQLRQGLSRPRTRKRIDAVWKRIGRLKEKAGEPPNATAFASPATKAEKKPRP